ncbi:MAG: ATP synthase F0 subunit C [Candidatus Saganbacteria bacterium]|nr:ATP synthase F0 subunit C [Candidatus Saganbacteria bacterium]
MEGQALVQAVSVFCAAFSVALAAIGSALGQGKATASALESIARQPEAKGSITQLLIVALAFIESLTLYALLIAIVLIFANPFVK